LNLSPAMRVQSEIEQARRMLMEDSEDNSDQLKIRTMERLKDATKKQSFHNFNVNSPAN
jgi:hypothetical protein